MLTESEIQEYIDMSERGEWDPSRWREPDPTYRVTIAVEYVDELTRRAVAHNVSAEEYISNVMGAILATA